MDVLPDLTGKTSIPVISLTNKLTLMSRPCRDMSVEECRSSHTNPQESASLHFPYKAAVLPGY